MRFVLLSCCAPCSCAIIKKLSEENTDFEVLFYNPNIRPYDEYRKRCDENQKLCQIYGVKFTELEYDNELWQKRTKGLEDAPERGERCSKCFALRLERAFQYAKENGFDGVACVLGVSRYKDLNQVNNIAHIEAKRAGIPYIEIEGRKGGMQELRNKLIKELNLYNQDYCGCKPREKKDVLD